MPLVIKLYIIKGNNTIAGIYFTNFIFLNNRFNMKSLKQKNKEVPVSEPPLLLSAEIPIHAPLISSLFSPLYFATFDINTTVSSCGERSKKMLLESGAILVSG